MHRGNRGGWYGGRGLGRGEGIRGGNREGLGGRICCFDGTMGIWFFFGVP